ncbi:Thioredoxin-2 [Vibrio nigripulchritudo SO65]|uniref:Thioredoxin n=1 Tax=Vibrio nigripulchritudo SOn1 TaxID=1238450 RepID=A0AAV2VMJ9_9VIBR|nr:MULTISPECIES: thioredoxin TrxC [Vibrio]UAB72354.1 thioredoxin TrxC [Vibrio sp. SCSIO 43132]CCN32918.1 Thioredoxin-2 [Vibrio nigripulchritudo AM115]CCN40395.1 Thioredoxin-2 [Vibrio nigripulchritudo FTn2]CCN65276.1 Thioredoxin-2 [Vibrio nigripulchritudo POn4]CCN68635.1 Thioredoxin-2 [Vibrio nigripulchritudo SFn118]
MSSFNSRCPSCQGVNRVPLERVSDAATCGKCKSHLFDGAPIEGTEQNIDALLQSDQPVVVDFWAPWCNPCVGFAPVFSDVAQERKGNVRFVKIDTEAQQNLGAKYQIRSIPTVMVFKGGKRVDVINGALPKSQFDQWLNQALFK